MSQVPDSSLLIEKDGRLQFEVYRKPTHTDQYLAFDSHHPLEHKLAVIKTLFHRADNIITSDTAKTDEHRHLRGALGKCGYQRWTFNKALKPSDQSKKTAKCTPLTNRNKANITIPYVQGVSEKLRRIFQNFNIATNFKPQSTLRQRLVHPKDRPRKGSKADVIYRLKCEEPNCNNTYIGETSRSLNESVIPNRYREIRAKVKEVIMEMFFDEEFLEKYLSHKLMEVANNVDMKAKVGEIVHSKTVDRLIDEKLSSLGTTPEGQLILKMGVDPKSLKPMIKPFLQGFGEDLAPMIKETLSDPMQVIDVSKLRKEMEKYMNSRMETLTEQRVTSLLEAVIRPHLGWIIVWGCVFGGLIGIITQAVGLAPSY
ncbi:Hypp2604 [Branchiostoma lanceolatum]|uniref:Hypp2604 protein n=1 Tax=Branchiostoma lanceolatum TaxID=7740 RepID=A0A8J9ZT72_BRALA|nr:Hypp2604 [Branchiostoma lanceolatum]